MNEQDREFLFVLAEYFYQCHLQVISSTSGSNFFGEIQREQLYKIEKKLKVFVPTLTLTPDDLTGDKSSPSDKWKYLCEFLKLTDRFNYDGHSWVVIRHDENSSHFHNYFIMCLRTDLKEIESGTPLFLSIEDIDKVEKIFKAEFR